MKTFLGSTSIILASFCAAPALVAESWSDDLYIKVFGGFTSLSDTSFENGGSTDAEFSGGSLFGSSVGYRFGENWSAELEYFYRSNDTDTLSGGTFDGIAESDYASTNLMLNLVYQFNQPDGSGLWGSFTPYVGLGLGFLQEVDIDFVVDRTEQSFSDSWVPSAQLIGGVGYAWTDRWSLFTEARYQLAGSVDLAAETAGDTSSLSADYGGLSLLAGIRFDF